MIALWFVGCAGQALEEGFEDDVEQGWICEGWGQVGPPDMGDASVLPVLYVALDGAESFRIQVALAEREATFPAEEDYFRVYTGASLIVDKGDDKCDDVIQGGRQRIDYVYAAISGTARAVDKGPGIGLEVEGIVLRPDDSLLYEPGAPGGESLPDITLGDGLLPSFERSGS